MTFKVIIQPQAMLDLERLAKSEPKAFAKANRFIAELREHPKTGLGHPEPLKGLGDNVYSRHITAMDRIIYEIFEDHLIVLIIELEGHYQDK